MYGLEEYIKSKPKPLSQMELLKMLSKMTEISFDGTKLPHRLTIFTEKGIYTFTAGEETPVFTKWSFNQ